MYYTNMPHNGKEIVLAHRCIGIMGGKRKEGAYASNCKQLEQYFMDMSSKKYGTTS